MRVSPDIPYLIFKIWTHPRSKDSLKDIYTWSFPMYCKANEWLEMLDQAEAIERQKALSEEFGVDMMSLPESQLVPILQADFINFYAPATVNPYVALAACGPWIITAHGAVLHDNGGYGMLGSGHGPDKVINAMSQNWVMANVMTPSYSHKRLATRLQKELGYTRGSCPFTRFFNSSSILASL